MKNYIKKNVDIKIIKKLCNEYKIDPLEASIFARRNITESNDLLYFLEEDLRFTHIPFLFNNMEDAVERILTAKEEGEKVLIFGDKDVDGITSTAILYDQLKSMGIDVQFRLPVGEDSYGLSINAINDFAKEYGSLIITVDCGISNNKEIDYANQLGIDVIVTDHHNPPEVLPNASIIIDPKLQDSGYPFKDISGAAVAYKLTSALRFSKNDLYNQELCFLNTTKNEDNSYSISCLKTQNLVIKQKFNQNFTEYPISITQTNLVEFLKGQIIFCWNINQTKNHLQDIFGRGIEFNLVDIQEQISKEIPFVKGKTLSQIKSLSKIARYKTEPITEEEGLLNLFITYIEKVNSKLNPLDVKANNNDLQLVTLAALADIMPMKNENRLFVKNGLKLINSQNIRKGIKELLAFLGLTGKPLTSTELSWKFIPALNAAGRMGQSDLALKLLIEENNQERENLAKKIIELNELRKKFVEEAEFTTQKQAEESFSKYDNKITLVIDPIINKGITGILATKMMQKYQTPAIAITFTEDKQTAIGSMRSCRNCIATNLLDNFGDFFINHGGHDCAAGFSFQANKIEEFKSILKKLSYSIDLTQEDNCLQVDAELPKEYITPELLNLIDKFEPYGEENTEFTFVAKNLKLIEALIVGKSERQHLKLVFDCGKYKTPAMFWGEAERLNRDFKIGDNLNILFSVGKNFFNGTSTLQLILIDAEKA